MLWATTQLVDHWATLAAVGTKLPLKTPSSKLNAAPIGTLAPVRLVAAAGLNQLMVSA